MKWKEKVYNRVSQRCWRHHPGGGCDGRCWKPLPPEACDAAGPIALCWGWGRSATPHTWYRPAPFLSRSPAARVAAAGGGQHGAV